MIVPCATAGYPVLMIAAIKHETVLQIRSHRRVPTVAWSALVERLRNDTCL